MSDPNFRIETPRLYISYFLRNPKHASFLIELFNSPLFVSLNGESDVKDEAKALETIKAFEERHRKWGYGQYIASLKPSREASLTESKPIGMVTLMRGEMLVPDVGFGFMEAEHGKGYGTESGKAIVEYAKKELGIPEVLGFCSPNNAASKRVLTKIGLEERAIMKVPAFGNKEEMVFVTPGMGELKDYGIVEAADKK